MSGEVALSRLYRLHAPQIFGLVLGRSGSRAVAEEVMAQTFEAAAVQFARGRSDDVTHGWLVTVAKRRLVDHWRRKRRQADLLGRLNPGDGDGAVPSSVDPDLWAAVDSLAPNQRAVLVLRYVDDWSVAEIAEGLEMSYRAAESLLARARASLRTAMQRRGVEQ